MQDKSSIDETLHDGFHGISDKLDQIATNGLEGIMNSLDKARNPIVNLPSSFGSSCKYIHSLGCTA